MSGRRRIVRLFAASATLRLASAAAVLTGVCADPGRRLNAFRLRRIAAILDVVGSDVVVAPCGLCGDLNSALCSPISAALRPLRGGVHPNVKVLWGSTAVPSRSNHLAWKQSPAAADLTADGRLCQHPAKSCPWDLVHIAVVREVIPRRNDFCCNDAGRRPLVFQSGH